ncbi:uncharacterized protein LOC112133433 isoform X1 [Pongo abelii]|uniref:uncharacterized protein LOC112133433 isoform X1 n=2 Tax=Pongo abelii TaxID=9601 RepID=UPI0030073594
MSLLRAGVDMLRSCPAVSLKKKSPAQPPHPPARRPNHCGSPPPPPPPLRLTNNPAMTSPSAASGSLRPPPLPQCKCWGRRGRDAGARVPRALHRGAVPPGLPEVIDKFVFSVFRLEVVDSETTKPKHYPVSLPVTSLGSAGWRKRDASGPEISGKGGGMMYRDNVTQEVMAESTACFVFFKPGPKIIPLWLVQWLINSGTWGKKSERIARSSKAALNTEAHTTIS